MESKERQWAQMKEKWYGRLTQCGSREIDEFAYTKGEKCVEQLVLRYQRTMITASADGEELSRMKAYSGQGVEIHGNWWNFDIGSPQA